MLMHALTAKIRSIFEREHERIILWIPVCMAYGIAGYFCLKSEPPLWVGFTACLVFCAVAYALRTYAFLFYLCLGLAFLSFGFGMASWRTHTIDSPLLRAPVSFADVTGKIVEIAPTPKGSKLILRDVIISKVAKENTPHYISVTLRSYDPSLVTGQIVSLRAGLFPPPDPAYPGGFDFSRYFYFREIGAVGYGIPPITARPLAESGASDFEIWFSGFRHRLTEAIRSYFHEPAGSVAAAFITGETREIPEEINNNMRTAGLYHLLAVSGMNLSVVAGLAFFSLRFLFAAIKPIALRWPVKKWAAFFALIASYIYLRVSGSPVSAERAFFMVSLVFIAILLDRDPTPMRSVAIAAFCIMLYEPEAVLTASFQLSFSATAALIASYEWGSVWFARQGGSQGWGLAKIVFYFAAVIVTSFIAWCATEPFIMYHFSQFSSYSLLANTIAEPLVSFVLMPLVIGGVLLLPFGLAWIAFTPMQYGVDLLLRIAGWTAQLPHAMWIVPPPTDAGFAVVIFGGIWIYFWKTDWRWLGIIPVVAGMMTSFSYHPADIYISSDGKHVAVRRDDGKLVMVRGRTNSVNAQNWMRAALVQNYADKEDSFPQCDRKGCILSVKGHSISVLKDADALADDCATSDVVIAGFAVSKSSCSAKMIVDKTMLDAYGSAGIWFAGEKIIMRQTREGQGVRPWVTHKMEGEE